jgi:hypothetical protein
MEKNVVLVVHENSCEFVLAAVTAMIPLVLLVYKRSSYMFFPHVTKPQAGTGFHCFRNGDYLSVDWSGPRCMEWYSDYPMK